MQTATKTISIGDSAPLFALTDTEDKRVILRDLAGHAMVLVFYASDQIEACAEVAKAFEALHQSLDPARYRVMGISLDTPEARKAFAEAQGITYPLLSDADGRVSAAYGVCAVPQGQTAPQYVRTAVLLDPNLRLVGVYPLGRLDEAMAALKTDLADRLPWETPRHIPMQAPVLLIPNVLSPEFCRELITVWETQGNEDSGFMKRDGEKTVGVYDYGFKIRRDHFVSDEKLKARIDRLMQRRVFPEIEKAFNYKCSRREDYKIACYDSERGGYFRAHRDNTSGGTAHRRWAMTINLNPDEYEGGHLCFPEYAPHIYKPGLGEAVIFSCSIMHEAADVLSGRRFALLAFFYGEAEAQMRLEYEQTHGIVPAQQPS